MEGKVKWFSEEKGYGFVVGGNDEDHFFGIRDVKGADLPGNGDLVDFESTVGNKGPKAINVKIKQKDSTRSDDRVTCGGCGKKMIPRIITGPPLVRPQGGWTPVPKKSICPFCGVTYQEFPASAGEKMSLVIFLIIFVSIAFFIGSKFLTRF